MTTTRTVTAVADTNKNKIENRWRRAVVILSLAVVGKHTVDAGVTVRSIDSLGINKAAAFVPLKIRPTTKERLTAPLSVPYQLCLDCETKEDLLSPSCILDQLPANDRAIGLTSSAGNSRLFRLSNGVATLHDQQQQSQRRQENKHDSIGTIALQLKINPPTLHDVRISFLPSDKANAQPQSMPLVVSPLDGNNSLDFLRSFMTAHRQWIDRQMLKYGAVLFRGFDIKQASDVEAAIHAFQPHLSNEYRGTSPRDVQSGTNYIFSAAEAPSYFPIAQHIEMSFLPAPPKQLFFSALRAPETAGGETALADFRKVYLDVKARSPKLFGKLVTKKLKYTRTHGRNGARWTHDVAAMQGWPDVFGTTDKQRIEQMARDENLSMKWQGRNNDTFVSEYVADAFQLHPRTGEPVWFNHAQVFHPTTFPAELVAAFRRTRQWRLLWHAFRVVAFSMVWYCLLRQKMALHVTFGDGSPISPWEMHVIRSAIHKNMTFNRWQQGDLVTIDNFSTSHGRQPTYDKGRKVVVAWSDSVEKSNLLSSMDAVAQMAGTMQQSAVSHPKDIVVFE